MDSTDAHTPHNIARDPDLTVGQQVGEYVIEEKIGEGGFGDVFKAVHPLIGKVVAIKVLHRRYSAQPEMVSRFIAEARAVNQIRHRNIIDIFAFGQIDDGRHYYVMEYLEGMTLEDLLAAHGPMALEDALPVLRKLARALDAAHSKGIAHRDLKPDNVFMVFDEEHGYEPKLLDFGIAKLLVEDAPQKHKTRTGAPIGTPQYMSPEQCRGRGVDHRTDIYGLGIMVYRMLTGALPFDGEDYMDVLLAQIQQEAQPPSELVPDLPMGVDEAIEWMLQKDPSERPPNLLTALRSLESAAEAAGLTVPRTPSMTGLAVAAQGPGGGPVTPSAPVIDDSGGLDTDRYLPSLNASLATGDGDMPERRRARSNVDIRLGMSATTPMADMSSWARRRPRPASPATGAERDEDSLSEDSVAMSAELDRRGDRAERAVAGPKRRPLRTVAVIVAGLAGAVVAGVTAHRLLAPTEAPQAALSANPPAAPDRTPASGPPAPRTQLDRPGAGSNADPAPRPATQPPSSQPPVVPATVTITVTGPPPGTEVLGPDGSVGEAPGALALARGEAPVELVFQAEGWAPATVTVVPDGDRTLEVSLQRKPRPRPTVRPKRPRKNAGGSASSGTEDDDRNTIEDPFK
ncbi:protein kinase domain-containing protein [Haliangium sp.]|uniref:serine/threonine-protein kinase n=1 Tax=Haliangium sp. TaxID=2663208 RepID=UPI003D1473DD